MLVGVSEKDGVFQSTVRGFLTYLQGVEWAEGEEANRRIIFSNINPISAKIQP